MNSSVTQLANAIRFLSMDAVQAANSGHPGAPMGMADMAYALWGLHFKHNPKNPDWFDRDRFVLSNGHASMLIYSLLHLTGYDVSIEDIKAFRQLHSKTPGHPEVGVTAGVDTSTGPLGQGIGNAVGFALSEKLLAAQFNRPGFDVMDHFTYCFLGDGCLMEGVSHEVASLAGTLKLSKLIVMYDSNGISIDGEVKDWFDEDVAKRFESYGWNVISDVPGHDVQALDQAIAEAKEYARQEGVGPTLIICKTVIGQGSPNKAGTSKAHGSPLGEDEIALVRQQLGWDYAPFEIPQTIYDQWSHVQAGQEDNQLWDEMFDAYSQAYPELAHELKRRMRGELPENFSKCFDQYVQQLVQDSGSMATRAASQKVIEVLAGLLPELIGGSADLTGSNLTHWPHVVPVRAHQAGRHINYGVREFGMSAMMNGMALHGGYLPFGATFLSFSDYSRNAIRMAALMKQRVVYVFTHDSIGVGEDGPTHQPNEHVAALRLIPNLDVWRPCDTVETAVAWKMAVSREQSMGLQVKEGGPSVLALSRQGLPFIQKTPQQVEQSSKGGYVLRDSMNPQVILVATGSETHLAVQAYEQLAKEGISARVVSMPCVSVFDRQEDAYRQSVLLPGVPRVFMEAGSTSTWYKYLQGERGVVLGIDGYGESAPAKDLFDLFGITADHMVRAVKDLF